MPLRWRDDPFETPIAHISDLVPFALDSAVVHKDALVYNVKDHGVKGDGVTDDTAAYEALSLAIKAAGGGVAYHPPGTYIYNGITHRSSVKLKGAHRDFTIFKAKAGGVAPAVIQLETGGAVIADLEDFTVLPNGNSGQHGIWFTDNSTNGCWQMSAMRNVTVGNFGNRFSGQSIWLQGGTSNFLAPHQVLCFDHVISWGSATGDALILSGQVGQVIFIGGEFDGPGLANAGVNIRCTYYRQNNGTETGDTTSPYNITFAETTSQSNGQAVVNKGGVGLLFDNPHFEQVGQSYSGSSFSDATFVEPTFTNAGHNAGSTGYLVSTDFTSRVRIFGGVAAGVRDKDFDGRVRVFGFNPGSSVSPITTGLSGSVSVDASHNLDCSSFSVALVNTSATTIRTIKSELTSGEVLFLTAFGGTITLESGGNIQFFNTPYTSPFVIPQGSTLGLIYNDVQGGYEIIGLSPIFTQQIQAQAGVKYSEGQDAAFGTVTGTRLGSASTQKLAFWGATPIVQPARVGQLTDSTGGTPSTTLSAQGATYSQSAINNTIASLAAKINALETILHNNGLTA